MIKIGKEDVGLVVLCVLLFAIIIGGWVGYSFFEAKTYNKITGSNLTTFDAMFVELRIQESVKYDN